MTQNQHLAAKPAGWRPFITDLFMALGSAVIVAAMLADDYQDAVAALIASLLLPLFRVVWRMSEGSMAHIDSETDDDWLDRQI